jgi:hypothetical protein
MTDMTEAEITRHRIIFDDVILYLKNGIHVDLRANSDNAASIIWASKRIDELEAETQVPEAGNDENREEFFCLGGTFHEVNEASYCGAVEWGQSRVRELEQHAKDIGEVFEQREKDFVQLHSHRMNRYDTIDELEAEIKRLTELTDQLSSNCLNIQSDEERHQRHRRERMLDEVTLICVRNGIEQMRVGQTENTKWGRNSRDIADSICNGINDFDANNWARRG